jgi:FKBP-type peptidyl-prolyl cis-trans isomerase
MRRLIIPLLALAIGISACNDDKTGPTPIDKEKFAPELKVDLSQMTRTASGLYYQDLVVGGGAEVVSDSTYRVHYTGWLVNGYEFDSSFDHNSPITVTIDVTNLIAGWHEGLKGMRVGGTRKLVIPSHLAYGARGAGRGEIPPHATLVFDVAVVGEN